jgi:DNA processing protein
VIGVGAAGPRGPEHEASAVGAGDVAQARWAADARDRSEERLAWAVLTGVDGVGPVTLVNLIEAFGSGRGVLRVASSPGGPDRVGEGLRAVCGRGDPGLGSRIAAAADRAPAFAARLGALGLTPLTVEDPAYPARLRLLEMPPPVLFARGSLAALSAARVVAVVGTRRPTDRGRRFAVAVGAALAANGATSVSGLALGIDGAVHAAACDTGGATVAVIGSGHARLYPAAHVPLAERILRSGGAVVSELAPDVPAVAGTFPRRNRIIAGLADATVVVEAGARSGALITAGWALE